MILSFPHVPVDETELRLPDVAAARTLAARAASPLEALLRRRRQDWSALLRLPQDNALLDATENAVRLGHARLAVRHGSLGTDFHAYHNEGHVLEICGERMDRLCQAIGLQALCLRALQTETQVMVKREDEQAFAELNGAHLKFVEDAARLLYHEFDADKRIKDFRIACSHLESLHSHDAVSVICKGLEGGFKADFMDFGSLLC